MRECSFEGCSQPHKGHGLCTGHIKQFRAGKELTPIKPRKRRSEPLREYLDRMYEQDPETGCHNWTGSLSCGYGQIMIDGAPRRVHRVMWQLEHGELPPGQAVIVRHTCDNRRCYRLDHLVVGSMADNSADMVVRGRSSGRVTPDEVREIRGLLREGASRRVIADTVGVTIRQVSRIASGEHWKAVT